MSDVVVIGPHGLIVADLTAAPPPPPPPPPQPVSAFAENLVELLPEYIPDDLAGFVEAFKRGLAATNDPAPPEEADDDDPGVRAARATAFARNQLLAFLNHPSFTEMQALMAEIAREFETTHDFQVVLGLADQLGRATTDVPAIAPDTWGSALRADSIHWSYWHRPPPEDQNDPVPPPVEVTGTLPGFGGPALTAAHRDQLIAFYSLLAGFSERVFRVGLLRAETAIKLRRPNDALAACDKLLGNSSMNATRKKHVAIRAAYAHLAQGDLDFRANRSMDDDARDRVTGQYDAAVGVVAAHDVSADNPIRQQIGNYVAVQKAKLEAGFNALGFKDGYVPMLRPEYIRERLLDPQVGRIALAVQARDRFMEFREKGNELDDQAAQERLDHEIAVMSSEVADERIDVAKAQRTLADEREENIRDGRDGLLDDTLRSATPSFLLGYVHMATGNASGVIESVGGMLSAAVGYSARKNELEDQLRLAKIELEIADREEKIAELEKAITTTRRDFLAEQIAKHGNRLLNAELFYALSNLYEAMAERNLEAAIRWVYLYERAVAFKRLDADLDPVDFDYRDENGIIPAPEKLKGFVQTIEEADHPSRPTQVAAYSISLRSSYPIEFNRLIQTGETDFVVSLYDLEKLNPGAFHRRLLDVRVEVKGSIPATGFGGNIKHEGFFVLRDEKTTLGPPAATRLIPDTERMQEALENLRRGNVQGDPIDGVVFYLLEGNLMQLSSQPPPPVDNPDEPVVLGIFEGYGETGRWHLKLTELDTRLVTDVLVHFTVVHPSSAALEERVEELVTAYEVGGGFDDDLDKVAVFSLRQQFPDTYDSLASGPATFALDADDFPTEITDPRVKAVVGQFVDAAGSGVEGVAVEFTRVDSSYTISRTTGDEGLTEAMDQEIPVVQPPEARVPAAGDWQVSLADVGDFARIDDVRLFIIYSFKPAPE